MKKIDSHQHFWRYEVEQYPWINDSMPNLKQDRLPRHLQPLLQQFNFDGSIVVQARQSLTENQFLLSLAESNPWILGVIGWLNLCDKNIEEQIIQWKTHNIIKGYRHLIQDETDPDDFMALKAFNHGVDVVLNQGLVYEVLIHDKNLSAATQFCARHDQAILVLDHVGKPNITHSSPQEWEKKIRPLANLQHVYCKLSGLITEVGTNWTESQIKPYIEIALNVFGPNRLLFGSDWPVCLLAGEYSQVYQLIEKTINHLSSSEQAAIWGNNASRVYNL